MKIYLAANYSDVIKEVTEMGIKLKWILFSYFYSQSDQRKNKCATYIKFRNNCENVLIDSGAYSFIGPNYKKNKKPNFDKYNKQYCDFIQKTDASNVTGYFEMDIDKVVGYNQVLQYRNEIEEVTDKVIPVWHKNRGISEFKKMCNDYKYVSIPLRNSDVKQSQVKMFVDYAHHHNCRIHGLAGIKKSLLNHIPLDSVDSTSWKLQAAFCICNGKKVTSDFTRNNVKGLMLSNYFDAVKKQEKYYEKWKWYNKD